MTSARFRKTRYYVIAGLVGGAVVLAFGLFAGWVAAYAFVPAAIIFWALFSIRLEIDDRGVHHYGVFGRHRFSLNWENLDSVTIDYVKTSSSTGGSGSPATREYRLIIAHLNSAPEQLIGFSRSACFKVGERFAERGLAVHDETDRKKG